jgi:hypothetical protein
MVLCHDKIVTCKESITNCNHPPTKFADLSVKENVYAAVRDITNEKFWKRIYIVLRAVFPALHLLCYCDKSIPAMDIIYYLSHSTTTALEKSNRT